MKLKVCGMRDRQNLKELVALAPDYIGLIFFPKSPRYIGSDYAPETLSVVPDKITRTGVFVNPTLETVRLSAEKYQLGAIQLHGNESPDFCAEVKTLKKQVIKAFQVDDTFDFTSLDPYSETCDYFLFDTKTKNYGGSGHKFDWNLLNQYNNAKPLFLSGGITVEDVPAIKKLNHLDIFAVDINSRFEIEPALKDIDLVKNFANQLRQA